MIKRLKKIFRRTAIAIAGLFTPWLIQDSMLAETSKDIEPLSNTGVDTSTSERSGLSRRMENAAEISRSDVLTKINRRLNDVEAELYYIKEGLKSGRIEYPSEVIFNNPREEFPGQRRGGGTHAIDTDIENTDRDQFPGRRQGSGGGDNS